MTNHGITEKAMEYIYKHSTFVSYDDVNVKPIGCKESEGYSTVNAQFYKKQEVDGTMLFLFEYYLDNNVVAKEVVQEVRNNKVFLCLEVKGRKKFKWTKDEQNAR
ncbi:MAG: hypothetical protein DRO67_03970 [Candidatus Asgardarchaeum californiense]|nr:MAG: hypothetical protein DRO67_03970 [Candidatus Asgardarchaeum californiense]